MSKTMTKPRKRLTREESQAQTRATLMAVGREHFMRYGLGGAVAEKIAEDAGYSRGALYSNFDGKEKLFLAVIREEQDRRTEAFRSISKEEPSAKGRLRRVREAIADVYTDPEWIVLRADFEAGALRSERVRQTFVEVHRKQVRAGATLIGNLARSSEIHMHLRPNEFIMIILNLSHGLAVTQRILGAELSPKGTRHLLHSLFDHLISPS
jgi:AcrR family transcriptional regulator